MDRCVSKRVFAHCLLEKLEAAFEWLLDVRRIEDEVFHFFPKIGFVLTAYDPNRSLKGFSSEPQFTVEREIGKAGDEPIRRVVQIALSRNELFAVPIGTNAIELFAHPPAAEIGGRVP